jgi:hypothetical protein
MSVSCCEMSALEGKLSKFIFPTLVPLSSTRRQLRKMATSGEQSFCVLDFNVNKSVVSVQRHFRTKFGTDPTSGKSVRKWYLQFQDTGCICKRKSTGRPSTEEEAVERVKNWCVGHHVLQISPRVISSWWGFIKDRVFVPLTATLVGQRTLITAAITVIHPRRPTVGQELD